MLARQGKDTPSHFPCQSSVFVLDHSRRGGDEGDHLLDQFCGWPSRPQKYDAQAMLKRLQQRVRFPKMNSNGMTVQE